MRAVRGDARGLDRAGRARGRRGARAGARLQRLDRRRAGRRASCTSAARPGIHRPALALTLPIPGRPVTLLDVGANADVRPEILVQFAFMGAAYASAVLGIERPRVGLLSNGVEAERGSQLVLETHARLVEQCDGSDALVFVGNVEGGGITRGRRRRRRHRRLHRQRRAEADRGRLAGDARRDPRRRDRVGCAVAPAACCCCRGCASSARRSTPSARAAPTCWGCAGSACSRTAASRGTASRARSCARGAASRRISSGARTARSRRPGPCVGTRSRPSRPLRLAGGGA